MKEGNKMEKEKYYISTAIAYTSGKPHIGNTYEIVLADVIARYKRLQGFDVYFQTENLHIRDPQAIRILTIYASLYQNESESKSHNVRWGNIVRFMDGSSKFFDRSCYGYRNGADGTLEIVPSEAAVVRAIYEWHNDGVSLREISRRLMDAEIKAPRGGNTWRIETIRKILNNEKYYGDVCLQKTYIADYFTGKQVPNRGEYESFLLQDHHTAIIPKCK